MPKNPANKTKQVKKNEPMKGAVKIFLAGCVAELYVLVIRRYYINGTLQQVVAWDDMLKKLLYAGLAAAAVGLIMGLALHKACGWKRAAGWWLLGAGLFLTGASWVSRQVYETGVLMMCIVVPLGMVLGILWYLYDRECFYALTILGASTLAVWVCRHGVGNVYWNTRVMIGAVVYLLLLALLTLAVRKADKQGGSLGKVRLLPADADALPIYTACGLSAAAVLVSLFSATVAYYAMWVLAVIIFALAVYYTVKQL